MARVSAGAAHGTEVPPRPPVRRGRAISAPGGDGGKATSPPRPRQALGDQAAPRAAGVAAGGRLGYRCAKRAVDIILAAVGLVLLAPVLIACAAAVGVSSPGPVLFRQARAGRGKRPFALLKFRSMRHGAIGPLVTAGGDARVTRVGRLLRRSKLDELPQLWNVLVGEMSLVGPRPEVPYYVERFAADYARILAVRPGITDFAAVEYREEEALLAASGDPQSTYEHVVLPAKIALYHRYLDEMSLSTDLSLLARTLTALLP